MRYFKKLNRVYKMLINLNSGKNGTYLNTGMYPLNSSDHGHLQYKERRDITSSILHLHGVKAIHLLKLILKVYIHGIVLKNSNLIKANH